MNPLKVKATGSPITSANISGLQTMTDAEVKNYIANVITEKFAAVTDGTGTAEINVTTNNSGSGTSIGTFVDTTRTESIGTHPATGAISTTTYTVKQVTAAATENITNRPLAWDSRLEEMTDGDIDSIMDLCVEAMAAESSYTAGQYRLSPTAPSGGTWVSRYTITDTAQGGNTVTYLWQKTVASSLPNSDYTPLKLFNGSNCKQMIESEIEQMLPNFRNRIIDTSIATYKIQSTAPSGGTWVEMGAQFADTREQVSPETYVGNYSGNFTGNYTGNYLGPIPYSAPYSAAGNFSSNFTGNYAGIIPGSPTPGPNYTGFYQGVIPGSPTPGPTYTSVNILYYTGYYTGPGGSYTGYYSGTAPYSGSPYTAPPSPGPNYTGTYTGFFAGVIPGSPTFTTFTGYYQGAPTPGPNYTGFYSGVIPGGPTPTNFTGYYQGAGNPYVGFYSGTRTFTGEYASGVEPGTFQYFTGYYIGIVPGGLVNYQGFYQGTPVQQYYTGYYQGPDLAPGEPGDTFTGEYLSPTPQPVFYTGFYSSFTGPTPTAFTGYYLGPAPAGPNFIGYYTTGPIPFAGSYNGPGPTYTGFYAGVIITPPTPTNFTGYYQGAPIPGPNYTGFYSGVIPGSPTPTNYTGFFTGFYAGPSTPGSNYTGFFTGGVNYTGFYAAGPTAYSAQYSTAFTRYFTGTIPGSPTPTNFSGNYAGTIPGSPTPGPNYTGFYTGYFSGVGTAYTGFYSGLTNYSGTYSGSYINSFTGNYSGATIQATKDTVSTIKLWIRTA